MPNDLFGFSENPFADGHHPRFLVPGRAHREAVAHLHRALEGREPLALLTGLPGVGRSVAVEAALATSGPHVRVTITASPALTREGFLEQVLGGFSPPTAGIPSGPGEGIETRLRAVASTGRAAVLVVEEAQDLARPLLDDLRLYSNLEAGGQALLQIILVGRPELEEMLADPAHVALRQRISAGYRLEPMDAAETEAYVRHRVAVAGGEAASLFTSEACEALHRLTHGIAGEVDRLAGEAIALARTAGEDRVTPGHVDCAVMMLGFRSIAGSPAPARESMPALAAEANGEAVATTPAPVAGADVAPEPVEPAPVVEMDVTPKPAEPAPTAEVDVTPEPAEPAPTAKVDVTPEPAEPAPVVEVDVTPGPAEPAPVVEVDVTPRPAAWTRHDARRRHGPPRERHLPRTAALTAAALTIVLVGVLTGMHSTRGRTPPQAPAPAAFAAGADEPATARPSAVPPARVAPAPARPEAGAQPTPAPAPAPTAKRPAPAEPERNYGVEVATFLSESRARTERDRLAESLQRPCRVVPTDEDGFAVVVGPVPGAREATRLSVDLAQRGLVSEARVVPWTAAGGVGH